MIETPDRQPLLHAARPAFAAMLTLLAACSSTPNAIPASPPVYPSEATTQAQVLNVQVLRSGPTMTFTNTTAQPLGPCRMWLNRRYSRMIDRVEVGQTVSFDLYSFVDEFGDTFRGGGFFSTERPEKLVLTQLETENPGGPPSLVGFITIAGGEDD